MNRKQTIVEMVFRVVLLLSACLHVKAVDEVILEKYVKDINGLEERLRERDATWLHFAADKGHLCLVEHLIKEKYDVNKYARDGITPLGLAAYRGHLNVVQCLVENGANIDAQDVKGQTPSHNACIKDHPSILAYLVESGANVRIKDVYKYTVLDLAQIRGNRPVVLRSINKRKIQMRNLSGVYTCDNTFGIVADDDN